MRDKKAKITTACYRERQKELISIYDTYWSDLAEDERQLLLPLDSLYRLPIIDRLLRENESQNSFTKDHWTDNLVIIQDEMRDYRRTHRHRHANRFRSENSNSPTPNHITIDEDEDIRILDQATSIFLSYGDEEEVTYASYLQRYVYSPGDAYYTDGIYPMPRSVELVTRILSIVGLPLDLTHSALHKMGPRFICCDQQPMTFLRLVRIPIFLFRQASRSRELRSSISETSKPVGDECGYPNCFSMGFWILWLKMKKMIMIFGIFPKHRLLL